MTLKQATLNGLEVEQVRKDAVEARENPENCAVSRKLHAEWVGGTRARVYSGDNEIFIGGEGDFGAMSVALASLLACEIDVLATAATDRRIEIQKLSIEGTGDFNYAKYVAGGKGPDPGYQRVEYTVKIKSRNATMEQLEDLAKLCETSSPVGDTFSRSVPTSLKLKLE
ncbi:MAG TPA: OsmC family protein [Nitrososphaerales archaeon]|nr:OsmC family protein [Nitrososphaerales archaeon]